MEKCGKEESNLGWSVKSEDWLPRRGARVTEVLSAKMWWVSSRKIWLNEREGAFKCYMDSLFLAFRRKLTRV